MPMTNVHPADPAAVEAALAVLEPLRVGRVSRALACAVDHLRAVRALGYGPVPTMEARLGVWAELRRAIAVDLGAVPRSELPALVAAHNALQAGRRRLVIGVGRAGRPLSAHLRRVLWDGAERPRVGRRVDRRRLRAVAGYLGDDAE